MNNGATKIFRGSVEFVAHVVSEYRKFQKSKSIFDKEEVKLGIYDDLKLTLNDISRFLFINEQTGERLEIS
jgi:hypothetical protein